MPENDFRRVPHSGAAITDLQRKSWNLRVLGGYPITWIR